MSYFRICAKKYKLVFFIEDFFDVDILLIFVFYYKRTPILLLDFRCSIILFYSMEGAERINYYRAKALEFALAKMCPNVQSLFNEWVNVYFSRYLLILPGKKSEDNTYIPIPDLSYVFVVSRTVSFVFRNQQMYRVSNYSLKYVKQLIMEQGLNKEFIEVSTYLIPVYLLGSILKSENIRPRDIKKVLDEYSICYNPYIVKEIRKKLLKHREDT